MMARCSKIASAQLIIFIYRFCTIALRFIFVFHSSISDRHVRTIVWNNCRKYRSFRCRFFPYVLNANLCIKCVPYSSLPPCFSYYFPPSNRTSQFLEPFVTCAIFLWQSLDALYRLVPLRYGSHLFAYSGCCYFYTAVTYYNASAVALCKSTLVVKYASIALQRKS